jgi:hypothetical protein
MQFKKILTAAATATVLTLAGAGAASADPFHGVGYHDVRADRRDIREDRRDLRADRHDLRLDRRMADRRVVFNTLRFHRLRTVGDPFFARGHYVVRCFDGRGRVVFAEVNPYTGGFIGFIRL